MRIAYFTDTYLPQVNGVTNTLSRLSSYLDKRSVENMVFAPAEDGNLHYRDTVDRSFSLRFFLYPECRLTIPNIFRIHNVIDKFKPDLIHCVTPFNLGLCGLNYARDRAIPLVSSYHTNFDQYLDYYNLRILQNIVWDYTRWFHNQCLANYAPSQATIKLLHHKGIKNLEHWGRGVDTVNYDPQKRSEELRRSWGAHNKLVLLYVGRLAPEKNLDVLAQSYKNILETYPQKLHLVVTGDGPLASALKHELNKNVTFTGYKKGQELAQIYASSDIFAFPSTTETFGNVVLEAMSSGLPVIGTAAGGVQENVVPELNGILCRPKSSEDFSRALQTLVGDPDLRCRMSRGARQYALGCSWDRIFSRLLHSYQNILKDCEINRSA